MNKTNTKPGTRPLTLADVVVVQALGPAGGGRAMIPPDEKEPPRDQPRGTLHVLSGRRIAVTRQTTDTTSKRDYEYVGMRLMGLAQLLARADGAPGEGQHLDSETVFLITTELTEAARRLGVGPA